MNTIEFQPAAARKLLAAASGDAALLYLYLCCGSDPALAAESLRMQPNRLECATALLRQLGLWPQEQQSTVPTGERPNYSEHDVLDAVEQDASFRSLYAEVQRRLGRSLNTEELKILLGFVRYLNLPGDVICLLISYCQERARQRGSLRAPSLRTIEKEAYRWAEEQIDTMECAAAYIQAKTVYYSRLGRLMQTLQIHGRSLTAAEERYAMQWLEMGFDEEALAMAYERTCLNTGGLSWAYMNKILARWHQTGLHTGAQIRNGEVQNLPKGASGQLGQAEIEAIQQILREGS